MNLPFIKWGFSMSCQEKNVPQFEIRDRLRLRESYFWRLEDLMRCPPSIRRSAWQYMIERENCWLIDDLFNELKETLLPVVDEIRQLCNEHHLNVSFTCVIYAVSGNGPEVALSKGSIEFLSSLNAELDFDLYYQDSEVEEY